MAIIDIEQLTFRYPGAEHDSLSQIELKVQPGEFIVLCGYSGSGKSTLLHHLKQEVVPHGERTGEIRFEGVPLRDVAIRQRAEQIGLVMQDPDNQIVMHEVLQELAFPMENLGYPTSVMRTRIAELSQFLNVEAWLHQQTDSLSGGQKQLLNLASVLLLQPKLLLLDEPTAQLDPVAARELLQLVYRLNQELGMTVIISEQRLEEVIPLADRLVVLDRGKVRYNGKPGEVIGQTLRHGDERFQPFVPSVAKLFTLLGEQVQLPGREAPLTVKEGRIQLQRLLAENGIQADAQETGDPGQADRHHKSAPDQRFGRQRPAPLLECRDIYFQYENNQPFVLRNASFRVHPGERLALMGGNGAGKSTLLQIMAGLLTPQRGEVRLGGLKLKKLNKTVLHRRIGYLAQNPLLHFAHDTVREELREAVRRYGNPAAAAGQREGHPAGGDRDPVPVDGGAASIDKLIARFQLESLLDRHPYDLSGGERQKAAMASVLLQKPELLLMDEPTKGLDPQAKRQLLDLLRQLHEEGLTIVIVSHDIEFAARFADRCAMLFDGAVSAEGEPSDFFGSNYYYTTTINRCVRSFLPSALTEEDVLRLWNEHERLR